MAKKTLHTQLMENLTVFMFAFYHDVDASVNSRAVEKVGEKIKKFTNISEDVDVMYIVRSYLPNGQRIPSRYHSLYTFIDDGVTIPEDAEFFEIEMKMVVRVDDMVLETKEETPLLKTRKFIVKENVNSIVGKLMVHDIKNNKSKNKLVEQDELYEFSGKRIKFGKNVNVEL